MATTDKTATTGEAAFGHNVDLASVSNRGDIGRMKATAAMTIAAIRFLIVDTTTKREIPARGDRAAMTIHEQPVIIVGGPRQVNWTLGSMESASVLPTGCYTLSNDCLRVGQFNRLELASRADQFAYLRPLTGEEMDMFKAVQTSLADFS